VDILLTSIVSLLAAMIGGWIAGKYALRAQKQAAEDQRQRDVEAERRTINSTLQAIGTELTVLKADFLDRLQQVDDGRERGFQIRGPLSRNYFAVFESNAAMLGKIGAKDLREKIIRVYGSAKSLFDYLNHHSRQSDTGKDAKLEELEQQIRAQIEEIQKIVSDVQKMILKYPA
jgi:succinate dehydrogenase/fumarate reductase flavoprotein subunit